MYQAQDSVYKQQVRDWLFKTVKKHVPLRNGAMGMLSLSNTVFTVEERFCNEYRGWVDAYERDKKVFASMQEVKKHRMIQIHNDDILNAPTNHRYSVVWLDFCNSYSDEFMTQIVSFVEKLKWDKKAVLSITMNKKRGMAQKDMLYNKVFPNYKDEGISNHIQRFINGKVIKAYRVQYICKDISTRGATMNLFTFLINN